MTEEIKSAPEGSGEAAPETQAEYSPVEVKAMEMGWRPKSEFSGAEEDFVDAKEFIGRAPLFERIDHQNKQIKNVQKALEMFKQHYDKVQETEYNRALATLKEQRKEALKEGDADRFDHLDTEITRVESDVQKLKETQGAPLVKEEVVHPEFQSWVARNPWYNQTQYMRAFADTAGSEFAAQGASPSEVLKKVEQAVRKEFPHKFSNPNKESAPDVDAGRGNSRRGVEMKLTDQERRIMDTLVRTGQMTEEKYLSDLKKIKG